MAKKVLCIVLSVAMLLGSFAVASSAGTYYGWTPEEAEAEVAEKLWYVDYDADVDWKDEIDRRFLTGTKDYDGSAEVAAPQEILEYNLFFWADEIIDEYHAASTNEDYWNLYNKMATPKILYYTYEEDGEEVTDAEIFYDYSYEYRDESKATFDIEIVADTEYAKPGDTVTVEVYGTSNFRTMVFMGGIFYDKSVLTPLTIEWAESEENWAPKTEPQLDLALQYNDDGSVKLDRRDDYWPEYMYTEENLEKYGCSYVYARGQQDLGLGNYHHARQFDNDLLFTATYQVKDGVADGTEIEFFVPDDCVMKWDQVGLEENSDEGQEAEIFSFYRMDYEGLTKDTYNLMVDFQAFYDHTVTANTETVVIGEEPAPATKGEIVDVYTSAAFVGDVTEVDVEVTGSPEALHFMEADGGYKRVARETATIVEFNGNELWTVDLFVADEFLEYTVYADYGDLGVTDGKYFYITAEVKADLGIHSIVIPDMYPDAQNGGVITAGKHDIIIKTSTDVVKIQFYDDRDGSSYTYTSWSGAGKMPYEDIDGERVWTISHSFGPYGYRSLTIRTRSAETFFAATDSTLDATVVY